MKKYIVIGLIVFVGGVLLIKPLLTGDNPIEAAVIPATFSFTDNLATVGDEKVQLEIIMNEASSHVELFYNDSLIQTWDNAKDKLSVELDAGIYGVGTRTIVLKSVNEEGREFVDQRFVRVLSDIIPEHEMAKIVEQWPHNPLSFTQGLEFHNGRLFEGTGDPGNLGGTLVAEVDIKTGEHLKKLGLEVGYFGEGITFFNNTLYQLTWQNQRCYTYDVEDTLTLTGEFPYIGEGWGLCNDGTSLIMSDGTERLVFRNPNDFTIERTMEVYDNQGPIVKLNELEYIDGKIYANVWMKNYIVVIDPISGKVLKQIDATDLVLQGRGTGEVLNGIAYDETTGKTFMTGKNWNKLFEVKFVVPGED
ncbi:MAG: glutaminyl-peptide cyclotransferase [Crocinitomicaceae bacterium]|nr:glutaminyl-peptide cyclotransferase [Crocinitomicaceae bacterium]